ncbi:MAG TPA: hypothetical protein PLD39_08345, partial [Flexilinea sp.]|nr:hypothetical protein [Flexilinea sp.]
RVPNAVRYQLRYTPKKQYEYTLSDKISQEKQKFVLLFNHNGVSRLFTNVLISTPLLDEQSSFAENHQDNNFGSNGGSSF